MLFVDAVFEALYPTSVFEHKFVRVFREVKLTAIKLPALCIQKMHVPVLKDVLLSELAFVKFFIHHGVSSLA